MRPHLALTLVVTLALASSFAPACTRGGKSERDTLTVALTTGPNTLDPRFTTDAVGQRITGLLFSSLVRVGPDLKVIGDAASSWEYQETKPETAPKNASKIASATTAEKATGKTIVFQLRPGLTFANGRPVTADDIRFTFTEFMGPKSPFARALKAIRSVEVKYDESGRWVKLRLGGESVMLLSELSPLKILPHDLVTKAGADFGREPIGSGPFRFVSQDANEIRLQAVTSHPRVQARIPKLVFKVIRDDSTRFLKTLKGDIDIVQSELPPQKVVELERRGGFQVFKYPGLSMTYLLINLQDPLLKNLSARQGLAHAVHRDEIIQYKLEGMAAPATSILSRSNPFHDATLKAPEFDPERARRLIQEAGLEGHEITLKTSNALTAIENGRVLVNQLEKAGLKVRLQSFEWGTFYGDVQNGNFQLATMKWVGAIDPDIYRTALHSHETPENSGRNRGRYSNPRLDRLLEDGLRIRDENERIRHYKDVQRIVLADLPFIPLWYEHEVAIANKRVKGYRPPLNGDYSSLVEAYKE